MISEKPLSSFALGCDGELFKTGGDVTALLDEGAHADDFHGAIPCSRKMTSEEIRGAYEEETGMLILETFRRRNIPMMEVPACLIHSHGPFA